MEMMVVMVVIVHDGYDGGDADSPEVPLFSISFKFLTEPFQ